MRKALIAGGMGAAPSALTGVAALTPESLEGKIEEISKVKKKKKKLKKAQPQFSNPELDAEVDVRSDVKTVDPEKTYTLKSGKTVTAPELETKKIQNKYVQGEKEVSGAKQLDDFTKKGRAELEEYKQEQFGSSIDPEGLKGVNVTDPDYNINEAYEFTQAGSENKFPSTRHHEGAHKFFSSIAQKHSPAHSSSLVSHILDNFFEPSDMQSITSNLSNYYDKNDPHFKEEHITHILDLLQNPEKRQEFHDNHSYMNTGEISPSAALKMDRERMNRIKSGYLNAVKFVNNLDAEGLNKINSFYNKKKKKQ
jgi:hypothetical protein